VRYYGLYANAYRGKVKKTSLVPDSLGMIEEELRPLPSKGWAEMIRRAAGAKGVPSSLFLGSELVPAGSIKKMDFGVYYLSANLFNASFIWLKPSLVFLSKLFQNNGTNNPLNFSDCVKIDVLPRVGSINRRCSPSNRPGINR